MSKTLVIGVVVAVVGLFTLGGFVLWQQAGLGGLGPSSPAPATPQPQTSDAEDFTLSEVEGWQTYRSDEFGFDVKYPEGAFRSMGEKYQEVDVLFYGNATTVFGSEIDVDGQYVPSFSITHYPLSVSEYREKTNQYNEHFGYPAAVFTQQAVNGRDAYLFSSGALNMGVLCSTINAIVPVANGTIELRYGKCEQENAQGIMGYERELFNQILSTFRFVE